MGGGLGALMAAPHGQIPWDILGEQSGTRGRSAKAKSKRRHHKRAPAEQPPSLLTGNSTAVSFGDQLIESVPAYDRMPVVSGGSGSEPAKVKERLVKRQRSVYVFVMESQARPGYFRVEFGHNPTARLRQHNRGQVLTTAHLGPWKMRHQLRFSSERRAKRFVRYLKASDEDAKTKPVARRSRSSVDPRR